MKIRFRLLAAGLLLCPVALTGARAETASRSGSQSASTQRADAAKKKPAAKPADTKKPATAAKPKTAPQTAKASVKTPVKPSTKNSDTDKPKAAVASAKKSSASSSSDKTKEKENAKTKTVASTAKPSTKPGKSPSKTEKPAPEKTVAKAQSSKKKTSAADDNDRDNDTPASSSASAAGKRSKSSAAGSRSATAAALTAKNGKAGKNSKTASRNAAANADDDKDAADPSGSVRLASESAADLPPSPPPLFVPTGLGLRFMGMPTGLPDVGSPTTALLNMAMLKTPAAGPRTARPSAAVPTASKPAAPLKLIDPQTARAAMQAQAGKQSAFRPALADASARRTSLPQMEEEAAPTLAYLTGPVAFVTKGAPPMAAATADNFWGSTDNWMFNHSATPAASKASGSGSAPKAKGQGKNKGAAVMASNTVSTNSSASPAVASADAGSGKGAPSQIKSRPLPTAVPAFASPTGSSVSNAAAEKPEPLASKPSLASPEMPAALAKAAAADRAGDLSERERAFVRSLAEAAERVEHSHDLSGQNGSRAASSSVVSVPVSTTTSAATSNANSNGTGQGRARSLPVSATVPPNAKAATSGTAAFVLTGVDSAPAEPSAKASQKSTAPGNRGSTDAPALHLTDAEAASGIQHPPASTAAAPAPADRLPEALPAFTAAPTGKVDIQSEGQTEYDQAANKVIYTGKVELNSKAVRLRGDHVEVFLKDGGGIERLEASGHVVLRTQATAKSSGHMASAGKAVYDLTTGEITLSDWPKIQGDSKSHVSTAATTVMVLKADGRALTQGPNRTLISN